MATDKEYKAVIDALSGECERLHKENEELKKALENHDTFMKYAYSQGKQDALSQEPTKREIEREYLFQSLCEDFKKLQAENDDLRKRFEQEPTVTSTDEPMTMVYPTIVCGDAISREAVIDLYDRYRPSLATHVSEFGDELKALPSVTQKSGRWIKSLIYENTYNCSKCGSAGYDTFKYCPNCGAKMESEVNNG